MSGNANFQPSPSSPPETSNSPDANNSLAQIRQMQELLQEQRERVRASHEATESIVQTLLNDNSNMPTRRRRRNLRLVSLSEDNDLFPNRSNNTSSTSAIHRPRVSMRERILRRPALMPRGDISDTDDSLQQLDLEVSSLAELLDPGVSVPRSSSRREPPDDSRRRSKRRKLEHDSGNAPCRGFRYGHFGQVVPGKLKMEIVSCDGGEFQDSTTHYSPNNVLLDDKSVYCTKSSRCNLLLRHPGELPFTLETMIIKAPERGFTAPVQEGMIFVSMSSDTILQDTATYQIQYNPETNAIANWAVDPNSATPSSEFRGPSQSSSTLLSGHQYRQMLRARLASPGHDGNEWIARRTLARNRNGMTRVRRDEHSFHRVPHIRRGSIGALSTNADRLGPYGSAEDPPPVTVTMESDHTSSEEEEESFMAFMEGSQRQNAWRSDSDHDNDVEDETSHLSNYVLQEQFNIQVGSSGMPYLHSNVRNNSNMIGTKEDLSEGKESLLAPNARFFIRKDRNKVKIKFDPPISGKFVLLKFWSPLFEGNIDIQHVAAYGYAGPRYFPAIKMR